jgi:molybdopterin-biosynthesis enzyme MoeA-like protein
MNKPNFYSVIIGTELLNGRRSDQHFNFLNQALLKRGWSQKASFVIDDEASFIESVFNLIKSDPNAVLFSFGGIGSTPDDCTRAVAAKVFDDGELSLHPEAVKRIIETLGDRADTLRLEMGNFPKKADLLDNIVNNIPGFSLQNRYFFMPGFPTMSHPMVESILTTHFTSTTAKYRRTLAINASEGTFLELMMRIPKEIEFSSLPHINNSKKEVEISFASFNENEVDYWIKNFMTDCNDKKITFKELT